MKRTAIILADGFEEVEALTTVDLLRRVGIVCDMISLSDLREVTGAHGIHIIADRCFSSTEFGVYDGLLLPGGGPGTRNLAADTRIPGLIRSFFNAGKLTAAICAAPTVLAKAGILQGKHAVCYPGMEDLLTGALPSQDAVCIDGNVITSRGVGTAIPFALALVRYLVSAEAASEIARSIVC